MDNRNLQSGIRILDCGYSDQPYIIKTDDGAWLMTVTVSNGVEGTSGEHVISARSVDMGKTWTDIVDISSPGNPESAYSVLYKTRYGRIYCFYNYNADNLRAVKADDPPWENGLCERVDTQGHFVFKYSDDHGRTWSEKWYDIPMRLFEVDRKNPYGGNILFFWNVGKPFTLNSSVYVPVYKIGGFGEFFMYDSEGALLCCDNIETEKNPEALKWITLPDGEHGIKAPRELTHVSEEHSFVVLSDGSIFCVFRTTTGNPWCSYSRDRGHSFSKPEIMRYADGRPIRHPRAANFIWKCENGKYLYWFHNNGGNGFDDRNPVWIAGAIEYKAEDGMRLKFSQPEILLYDMDPLVCMSYPDLVEEEGLYFITETQKSIVRIHQVDNGLIEGLWAQFEQNNINIADGTLITDKMPKIKPFIERIYGDVNKHTQDNYTSFAFKFKFIPDNHSKRLFSTENNSGKGISIIWDADSSTIVFCMSDGKRSVICRSDSEPFQDKHTHTVTIIVDGGPRIVLFVVNGKLCDGGQSRQFGYSWFDQYLIDVNGNEVPYIDESIKTLILYQRHMRISEAVMI